MHYYNIKIKSDDSEYSLNSTDKDIIQREMDLYFASLFDASAEFVEKIKKIEKKDVKVKSIDEFENYSSNYQKQNTSNDTENQPEQSKITSTNDEFTTLSNPTVQNTPKKENPYGELVFKPVVSEELAIKKDETTPPQIVQQKTEEQSIEEQKIKEKVENINTIQEPISIRQNNIQQNSSEADNDSSDLKIIGIEETQEQKISQQKQEKEDNLNKTIELVQNAVNNIDIASDETFDIDIPDTYTKPANSIENIELKDFDDDFDESIDFEDDSTKAIDNTNAQDTTDNLKIINNDTTTEDLTLSDTSSEIGSIFSNESPFENPPEAQNIIAAKQYPEEKKALNLDFKTFLSNYEANGIIDEFLICAYYIKHISGQHSFTMKYINSKIFQATGNIADSSVINGLITGNFIKVIEVDGVKKYTISSTGEEYFVTHYQR